MAWHYVERGPQLCTFTEWWTAASAWRDRQSVPRNWGNFWGDTKRQNNECSKFNLLWGCFFTDCKFRHVCRKCGGMHPAGICFKSGRQFRPQQNRGQANKMQQEQLIKSHLTKMPTQLNPDRLEHHLNRINYDAEKTNSWWMVSSMGLKIRYEG